MPVARCFCSATEAAPPTQVTWPPSSLGRFLRERPAAPAVALSDNGSAVTAIANDYGFDAVFARQVEGLGRAG